MWLLLEHLTVNWRPLRPRSDTTHWDLEGLRRVLPRELLSVLHELTLRLLPWYHPLLLVSLTLVTHHLRVLHLHLRSVSTTWLAHTAETLRETVAHC